MLRRYVRLHIEGEAYDLPFVAGAHECENVDSTVGKLSLAVKVVRSPYRRNPSLNQDGGIPDSL